MTNKPWKAKYWPMIVKEIQIDNEKRGKKNLHPSWVYIYDYRRSIYKLLNTNFDDKKGENVNKTYFYVNEPKTMQKILDNWENISDDVKHSLRRTMKGFESKYLHMAIYKTRKEEFDALVAEVNS
jgi:hypothetical protein